MAMESMLGWLLDGLLFLAVIAFALGILFVMEKLRKRDADQVAGFGRPISLCYRGEGHGLIPIPDNFLLHERFGASSDSCRVECALLGSTPDPWPALFEYATFRSFEPKRKMGYPSLVLAVTGMDNIDSFSFRPRRIRDWIVSPAQQGAGIQRVPSRRWMLRSKASSKRLPDQTVLSRCFEQGLWMQHEAGVLYLIRIARPWRPIPFDERRLRILTRKALVVLDALDHRQARQISKLSGGKR